MTNKQIKALALAKYPIDEFEWATSGVIEDLNEDKRKAYEQGLRAGIKLAKQKKDDTGN
jgi:hypothetical protein